MLWLLILATVASAQEAAPPPQPLPPNVQSPVVDDGRVTFSVYAPKAALVSLRSGEISFLLRTKPFVRDHTTGAWNFDRRPFTRGENGVWTLTLGPLAPGIYDYSVRRRWRGRRGSGQRRVVEQPPRQHPRDGGDPGPPGQPRHDEWRPCRTGRSPRIGTTRRSPARGAGCTCTRRRGTTRPPRTGIPSSTCSMATRVTTGSGRTSDARTWSPTTWSRTASPCPC